MFKVRARLRISPEYIRTSSIFCHFYVELHLHYVRVSLGEDLFTGEQQVTVSTSWTQLVIGLDLICESPPV